MSPFRKFVFCATDFYRATGIRYWILILHGCLTNEINIYSPKGVLVKPFCGTFLLCCIFFAFFGFPLIRNGIPKWIFLWHMSIACQGLKGHQRSAA